MNIPPLLPGQRYWNPTDPNRGCYTCGARPSGHYHDGSPSYTCSHPPTDRLAEVVEVSFTYHATLRDMSEALATAKRWQELDAGLTGKEWEPRPPWTQLTTDWRSILAEEAASRITGLERFKKLLRKGDRSRGRSKNHDIGNRTEVRCPQRKGRGFRFTEKDLQRGRLGILIYDNLFRPYTIDDRPTFIAVGWIDINQASRNPDYVSQWSTEEKREWLVPAGDMRPMEELPDDA